MIDARVELYYDGGWHDITGDVDMGSAITVPTFGQPDEHGESVATGVGLVLDNTDRSYSPKDPLCPLFGKIGLNTPLRIRIADPQPALSLPGVPGSYARTPDHGSLDVTGDLDVRIELTPRTWRPSGTRIAAAKWRLSGNNISWALHLHASGLVELSWSPDGTLAARLVRTSTAAVPAGSTRLAVRATLDVNNGAGGHTVTFYTAPSLGGSWTQLGAAVTTAGTTSIDAGDAEVSIGAVHGGGPSFSNVGLLTGRVHALQVRNGIAGSVVANPDFGSQDVLATAFTDSAGRGWTIEGLTHVTDPSLLASVTVASWTPSWDESTLDAQTAITGAGILRILGDPVRSSLFRDLVDDDNVVAYYPLEDGAEATRFSSGLANDPSVLTVSGAVTPADFSDFVASAPLPTVDVGFITGVIPAYSGAVDQRVFALVAVPGGGVAADRALMTVSTGGAVVWWEIAVNTAGSLKVRGLDANRTQLFDSGFSAFAVNGKFLVLSLWLAQDGAATDWQLSTFQVGAASGNALSGTHTSTYGRFTTIRLGDPAGMSATAYGHVTILNDDVHSIWGLIGNSLVGWAGEPVGERLIRLAREQSIPLVMTSDPADTALLGTQEITELLTLVGEATQVDLGILGEQRDRHGLRYRPRADRYNQAPVLTLDMDDGHVINPFAPPLDDQGVTNDITVTRSGGSSYRAVQTSGPRNVNDPRDDPDGVGRHPASLTLNLATDAQARDQATWRRHLGTVDEHRVSVLEIELEHHPDLVQPVLELQQGDVIRLLNPPEGMPPGPVDLLALGWSHHITTHRWRVALTLAPASPWTVIALDDGVSRLASGTSTLTIGIDDTDASFSVTVAGSTLWTTDDTQFPFPILINGEQMTVTDITGSTSPQTFTVVRSDNGISKSHDAGTPVRLARRATLA
ncbi:MAG: hypothetical protein ACRDTG_29155 [Pseudonocardiaceae bacterium]